MSRRKNKPLPPPSWLQQIDSTAEREGTAMRVMVSRPYDDRVPLQFERPRRSLPKVKVKVKR